MIAMLWIQQHTILLLLGCIVLLSGLLIARLRRHSRRWWGAWGGLVSASALTLFMLHTAPIAISEHSPAGAEYLEPYLTSVAQIKSLLAEGAKPTLVEFYVDYGFN